MTHKSYGVRALVAAAAFSLFGGIASAQLATDTCDFGTLHPFPYTETNNHNGFAANWMAAFAAPNTGGDAFYEFSLGGSTAVEVTCTAAAINVLQGIIIDCPVSGANFVGAFSSTVGTSRARFALPTGSYGHFWGPRNSTDNNNSFTATGAALVTAQNTTRATAFTVPSPGDGNTYNFNNVSIDSGALVTDSDLSAAFGYAITGTATFYALTPVNGTGGDFTITSSIPDAPNNDTVILVWEGAPASVPAALTGTEAEIVDLVDDLGVGAESLTVTLTEGQPYTVIMSGWRYGDCYGSQTITVTSVNAASVNDWTFME